MKLIAYSLAAFMLATAAAETLPQNTTKRVVRPRLVKNPQSAKPSKLSENITLQLIGNLHGLAPISISLTGTGPEFLTDTIIGPLEENSPPPIARFQATVIQLENSDYSVAYTLSARIGIVTSTTLNKDNTPRKNYEFRDVSQSGSVILTQGKPTVISNINGEALTLQISSAP